MLTMMTATVMSETEQKSNSNLDVVAVDEKKGDGMAETCKRTKHLYTHIHSTAHRTRAHSLTYTVTPQTHLCQENQGATVIWMWP